MKQVTSYLESFFLTYLEDLTSLVKIPSVSSPHFSPEEVQKSAEAVSALMKKRGLQNVEIFKLPGAHPYVYGDWLHAPGKITLLLYAHHDVQPPGREEFWKTPPFEATLKIGPAGDRLYGRGTADDKAGVIAHLAAIHSYLETVGFLPINVKVLIEGEEEIGSVHLEEFLKKYRNRLQADVLWLTDCTNLDCGIPALTTSLRGIVDLEVEVKALEKTIHSGMWGGPIPDPALALAKILADLVDENGQIAVPGILEQVQPLTQEEENELKKIPYQEEKFRKQCGILPGVFLWSGKGSPYVQLWRSPSLTVNALQASSRKQAGNIINSSAWAKVTVRLVPHMHPERVLESLKAFLKARVPWGLHTEFHSSASVASWLTDAKGPAFDAAVIALEKGYGHPAFKIGCGGSIPFVSPFVKAFGGIPALLVGIEDPYTNAHGENESLLISDFLKSCLSEIYLFTELSSAIGFHPHLERI